MPVSTDGQYVIANVDVGVLVRLVWFPPANENFHQPAPVNVTIVGSETHRDIDVARIGSGEFPCESPILSGTVFEAMPDGRRPLAQSRVVYALDTRGFDAYTKTDTQGRFAFCDVREGNGRVGAGDCNDAAFFISVNVNGDSVADIDLTDFNASCPGVVIR